MYSNHARGDVCCVPREHVPEQSEDVRKACVHMFRATVCAMPPDCLACCYVPLHSETLEDGTGEGEREIA